MNRMNRLVILFYVYLSACNFILAQDLITSFRHISTSDGLANNNINCFVQDKWGYVWIGTANGLSCYDAYSFTNYYAKRENRIGLVSSNIQSLYCDDENNIWVGTASGGLSVLDRKTGKMHAYHLLTHNARFNNVGAIVKHKNGKILLGTDVGLYFVKGNIDNLQFSSLRHYLTYDSDTNAIKVNAIENDKYGRSWIGSESGSLFVLEYKNEPQEVYKLTDLTSDQRITAGDNLAGIQDLCLTDDNVLWLATWGRGFQYFDVTAESLELIKKSIKKIVYFFDGEIPIGTGLYSHKNTIYGTTWNQGLVIYDQQRDTTRFLRNSQVRHPGLVTNDLFSVFVDRDANVWIGASRFGGVSLYTWKSQMVEHYELGEIVQSELDRNRIYALDGDGKGNVFIAGVGGMFKFHNSNLDFVNIPFPISESVAKHFKVLSVEYDNYRNKIWAGCDGVGLFNYDLQTKRFEHFLFDENQTNGLSNNSIHEIFMGPDGVIWIGSWGGGLDSYSPEKKIFKNHSIDKDATSDNIVLDIAGDKYGDLWLATMGKGLVRFNKSHSKMYHQMVTDKYGNIPHNYYFVYVDDQENIWAACLENGLVRYKPATNDITWFNDETGVPFGHIAGIEPGIDTTLLVNTDNGVYIIGQAGEVIENYSFTEDLTPMTFWNESSLSDDLNWVYLAGDKGLVRYNPNYLKKDTTSPKVQITSLELFNEIVLPDKLIKGVTVLSKPIEETEIVELPYNLNSLAFRFSAMDYTSSNTNANAYKYKLAGFDQDWVYTSSKERKATYTNLPPGKYKFIVKATNSDGVWSEQERMLEVIIVPPFWYSLWFIFLIALFVISSFVLIVKLRQRSILLKNKRLKNEVSKRTQEVVFKNNQLSGANKELSKQAELLNISNEQIKRQKELLEVQNKDIHESISYAKELQQALLPDPNIVRRSFPESFVLFRPKEAISGDFYWTYSNDSFSVFLTADCTGHGIPGAMLSMLGLSFFNTIATVGTVATAGEIVRQLGELFCKTFCETNARTAKDSMDLSVCVFNKETKELTFSGVFNSLFLVRDGHLIVYPADRIPLSCENANYSYTNHVVDYKFGDVIYMFSDGFQDQFGGPDGKKFKVRKFKNVLCAIAHENLAKQNQILTEVFASWLFNINSNKQNEQTDDVLVVGIRLTTEIFE